VLRQFNRETLDKSQQSQTSAQFPRDYNTADLFSVYERLYSLAKQTKP
jgi:hypothetical protein